MESGGVDIWQALLGGALAVGIIFLFRGGIRAQLERSKLAPKDWPGFLIPMAVVIVFVFLLISLVR